MSNNKSRLTKRYNSSPPTLDQSLIQIKLMSELQSWCISRFKWKCPRDIRPSSIERNMLKHGLLVFYFDTLFDRFMLVPATPSSIQNVYGDPSEYTTSPAPGYESRRLIAGPFSGDIPVNACVPIWSRLDRGSELDIITYYAHRLAELEMTLSINARLLRVTRVGVVPESQLLTAKNFIRQIARGESTILASESFDPGVFTSLDIGANPSAMAAVRDERNQVWNDLMTYLGIDNANRDKAERLVVAEAVSNNGQIEVARNAIMDPRKEAVEEINRVWPGANIKVEWNTDNGYLHNGIARFGSSQAGLDWGFSGMGRERSPEDKDAD